VGSRLQCGFNFYEMILPPRAAAMARIEIADGKLVSFDERLKPGEFPVPQLGDLIEVFLDFFNWRRIELKQALAAGVDAAHEFRLLKHAKMLGDRLPCKPGAAC